MSNNPWTLNIGSIVRYNGSYYLFLGLNKSNKCRLLTTDLRLYSGTPNTDKLELVKKLPIVKHKNGHFYCHTKHGFISLSTGKLIKNSFITSSQVV